MTKLVKYVRLFSEPDDIDIPLTSPVGLATTIIANVALVFYVQPILFADGNSVGNRLLPNLVKSRLGDDDSGVGLGWGNVAHQHVPTDVYASEDYVTRKGWCRRGRVST
jgi:hypothetical protein